MKGFLITVSVAALFFLACNKIDEYDKRPKIFDGSYSSMKDASGRDSSIILKFTFTDGDGNVGLTQRDTVPPYDRNLLIDYYEKQNGQFTKILFPESTDTLNFYYRIKQIGNGQMTKGEVEVSINVSFIAADTIRFDYYILDRDLNRSNTISTGPIVLSAPH